MAGIPVPTHLPISRRDEGLRQPRVRGRGRGRGREGVDGGRGGDVLTGVDFDPSLNSLSTSRKSPGETEPEPEPAPEPDVLVLESVRPHTSGCSCSAHYLMEGGSIIAEAECVLSAGEC